VVLAAKETARQAGGNSPRCKADDRPRCGSAINSSEIGRFAAATLAVKALDLSEVVLTKCHERTCSARLPRRTPNPSRSRL
jgi:hypothetical protein